MLADEGQLMQVCKGYVQGCVLLVFMGTHASAW